MLKEALEYLINKTKVQTREVDGLTYSDGPLTLIEPPAPAPVEVSNLRSMVKLIENGVDDFEAVDSMIRIVSHETVWLQERAADNFGNRTFYVKAQLLNGCPFSFGKYMDPESFVIALQTMFVEDAPLKALLQLASNLAAENTSVAEDDGISQTATFPFRRRDEGAEKGRAEGQTETLPHVPGNRAAGKRVPVSPQEPRWRPARMCPV